MKKSPWLWVPSLYFTEGLPYVLVMSVSLIMYKRMGISNTDIALYTSWLYLPWVIKPLWSPVVELFGTKRLWILAAQLLLGAGLACAGLAIPVPGFFKITLVFFWLIAFNSATHDIAADGFYILGLDAHQQTLFVGIRSTFYRIATVFGEGVLVVAAGYFEDYISIPKAWMALYLLSAAILILAGIYHSMVLPSPEYDRKSELGFNSAFRSFGEIFISFFRKKGVFSAVCFLLLYRFGESQLVKLAKLFIMDERMDGGLEIGTKGIGLIYGTVGVISLLAGGILGGLAASRHGLKKWIWWMAIAINVPDLVYVYLSFFQPENFVVVTACVAVEQLGYGFGFAAYMLFMVYFASDSEYKTAHYAIMTGFMALGMMLPGMWSGWLEETIGYRYFFIWVCLATIPSFTAVMMVKIDPEFGKTPARKA